MSSSGGEMRGFIFAVVFLIIFSTLLSTVPLGLQGPIGDEDPNGLTNIDPSLLTGFTESENYTRAAYSLLTTGVYYYDYTLPDGGREWRTMTDDTFIWIGAKAKVWVFWLGGFDVCLFISPEGVDRGTTLTFDEIEADATDGEVRYSLEFQDLAESAGAFVIYWNTTAYASVSSAWAAEEVYMLHGIGIESSAGLNIGSLLLGLLFFQLPNMPFIINAILATPLWACILFVLWFLIKETLPFV